MLSNSRLRPRTSGNMPKVPSVKELEELQQNVQQLEADLDAARREHGKRPACIGQLRGDLQLRIQCLPARQPQIPQVRPQCYHPFAGRRV